MDITKERRKNRLYCLIGIDICRFSDSRLSQKIKIHSYFYITNWIIITATFIALLFDLSNSNHALMQLNALSSISLFVV